MPIKKLLNGNVLVRKVKKEETKTQGGVIIIAQAEKSSCQEVEIIQLPDSSKGSDALSHVEVGDIAYIGLYAGMACSIDGEECLLINLQDIILVF